MTWTDYEDGTDEDGIDDAIDDEDDEIDNEDEMPPPKKQKTDETVEWYVSCIDEITWAFLMNAVAWYVMVVFILLYNSLKYIFNLSLLAFPFSHVIARHNVIRLRLWLLSQPRIELPNRATKTQTSFLFGSRALTPRLAPTGNHINRWKEENNLSQNRPN